MLHIENGTHVEEDALLQRRRRAADDIAEEVGVDDVRGRIGRYVRQHGLHLGGVGVVVGDDVDGHLGLGMERHVLFGELLFAGSVIAVDDGDDDLIFNAGVPADRVCRGFLAKGGDEGQHHQNRQYQCKETLLFHVSTSCLF